MDRFVSPCPPPDACQRELVEILIEECAEVQQRGTKMLRFGVTEVQPGQDLSNAQRLAREIGDLLVVVEMALEDGLITQDEIDIGREHKRKQLAKFRQHRR
jgi:hypothetical protein